MNPPVLLWRRMLAPLRDRILLLIGRGVLRAVDDGKLCQVLQVEFLAGEVRTLERFQPYGLTSHPHPGAEVLAAFMGGNRDHGLALQVEDRRYRIKGLAQGEVALYDDQGTQVTLRRNGDVEVQATRLVVSGDLIVGGNVQADGDVLDQAAGTGVTMEAMRTAYNSHTHGETGTTTTVPAPPMV